MTSLRVSGAIRYGRSAEEYAEIMNKLKLPNLKMIDLAVPANRVCGKTRQQPA